MKHRPILFSTPMVQAILDGRKTQTRRIMKPQPTESDISNIKDWNDVVFPCPYGQVGDVLWVREKSCYVMLDHAHDLLEGCKDRNQTVYATDVHEDWMEYAKEKYGYKWTPSIFMPKSVCRIFLRITNVRVERLQDISHDDAAREGVIQDGSARPSQLFATLWQSINGEQSWNDNPLVWVIEFERIEKPENF